MSVANAEMIWILIGGYCAIGAAFAVVMILGSLKAVDPLAYAAPWRVKLLLVPGFVALWPLVGLVALSRRPVASP